MNNNKLITCNINNIACEKIALFSKTKSDLMMRVALLGIFVNLFNVWFNWIPAGILSASVLALLVTCCFGGHVRGISGFTHNMCWEREEYVNSLLMYPWTLFLYQKSTVLLWEENKGIQHWSFQPLWPQKGLLGPLMGFGLHFETPCLREQDWWYIAWENVAITGMTVLLPVLTGNWVSNCSFCRLSSTLKD